MEDDRLKDLFSGFDPEMKDDSLFMNRLANRLDSVEILREHNARVLRRSRRAVWLALAAGLSAGMLLSSFRVALGGFFSALFGTPDHEALQTAADVAVWLVIGFGTVAAALGVWHLAASPASVPDEH